jgi:beta-glucanase (GH16 family)
MKAITFPTLLICFSLLLAGCAPLAAFFNPPDPNSWQPVWSDEFDQPDGSAPDPAKWNYQKGGSGWGNAELQYYTDSRENSYIQDGMLVIKANEEYMLGREYTSARLTTQFKGDWTFGRIEIRAKLPNTQGIWPAFWMMPSRTVYGNWPAGGEIDIMELIGKEPGRSYGTLHFGNPLTSKSGHYDLPDGANFSGDFHTFALEWEPGELRWYVDDNLFHTVNEWFTTGKEGAQFPAPFDTDFYLLVNMAVGGRWPGNPDETSLFPQMLYVDYIRVYQHPK